MTKIYIYIVSHIWDNGESYDDKEEYEKRKHFSSKEKAEQYYNSKIANNYSGGYSIIKSALDNPDEPDEIIVKTEYHRCPIGQVIYC